MTDKPHIYIVAAEPSGEQLGAALITNIRDVRGNEIAFSGVGGPAMQAQGVTSPFDISPLSLLGLLDGLKTYPTIMDLVRRTVADVVAKDPDVVVLIDSWGFMVRVAEGLKKAGIRAPIIKYVAPQVWAMREGRSKVLARCVDHLLTIHSFDAPYFEREGLPTTYIGNPIFDTDYRTGDGAALRAQYDISPDAPICAVMFGSRLSEIQRLAKPFADTVSRLKEAMPELVFMAPLSENIATDVFSAAGEDPRLNAVILLEEKRKLDVFDAARAALACSGTVTTQLACAGVPTVLAYKLGAITWPIVSRMYKPDYVGIVNIAAGQELMPEFLQKQATGQAMADALLSYLQDDAARKAASDALIKQTDKMRGGDARANPRAAAAVLDILSSALSES